VTAHQENIVRHATLGLAVVLLALAADYAIAQPSVADTQILLPRPDVKQGEVFIYRRIDDWNNRVTGTAIHEVVEVTDSLIRLRITSPGSTEPGGIQTFTRDWNLQARGTATWTPFYPANQFPLTKVGQKWSGNSEQTNANGDRYEFSTKSVVEAVEDVEVPAGKFRAVRVKVHTNYQAYTAKGNGRGTMTETYWYAPGVSRHVRYAYEDTSWSGQPYRKYHFELEKAERK
jgi:hypothetical protein